MYKINIELYEDINMDYIFKDIQSIVSVEMHSNNNCKIFSMISTFENCKSLVKVNITGFNTQELTSMKNLFYNSIVSNVDLNIELNTIEDMSYMFAGTNIDYENLLKSNLKSNNLRNASYMFYNCNSLTKFDFSIINTSMIEDMSHMFESCESISEIDTTNINTKNVKNFLAYLIIAFY